LAAELPFLVQLHVFSAFSAMAVLPFTRVAPLLIVPFHHSIGSLCVPVSALAEPVRRTLELALQKYNPLLRIWLEEE
jgi:hypothetical protein